MVLRSSLCASLYHSRQLAERTSARLVFRSGFTPGGSLPHSGSSLISVRHPVYLGLLLPSHHLHPPAQIFQHDMKYTYMTLGAPRLRCRYGFSVSALLFYSLIFLTHRGRFFPGSFSPCFPLEKERGCTLRMYSILLRRPREPSGRKNTILSLL